MSNNPESKRKAMLLGVAGVLIVVAVAVYYLQTRPAGPDAATKAAIERTQQMQSNMETQQPPANDIPLEKRAPRGAVGK